MTRFLRQSVLVFCALLIATQASATIVLLSQSRSVSGSASATDDSDSVQDSGSIEAQDFGLFEEGIGFTMEVPNAQGSGSATQDSEITPIAFSIHGSAAAGAEGWDLDGFAEGNGDSDFEVLFEVPAPTPFTMSGSIAAYDNGTAGLRLERNGQTILFLYPDFNEETPVAEEGVLEPGAYVLTVYASASAYGDWSYYDYGFGSFDVDVALETATPVGDLVAGPTRVAVAPNPFSAATSISYRQAVATPVRMSVYDLRGRLVREFSRSSAQGGTVVWDSRDEAGHRVSPGVYFLRLASGSEVTQAKITLVR